MLTIEEINTLLQIVSSTAFPGSESEKVTALKGKLLAMGNVVIEQAKKQKPTVVTEADAA